MKNNILLSLTFFAILSFTLQGCLNDKGIVPLPPETFCDSLDVSFNLHVLPLANAKCAISGCHNGGTGIADFTSYAGLSNAAQNIKVRIQLPSSNSLYMPQGGTLTQEELDIFLCWIEDGAQNN